MPEYKSYLAGCVHNTANQTFISAKCEQIPSIIIFYLFYWVDFALAASGPTNACLAVSIASHTLSSMLSILRSVLTTHYHFFCLFWSTYVFFLFYFIFQSNLPPIWRICYSNCISSPPISTVSKLNYLSLLVYSVGFNYAASDSNTLLTNGIQVGILGQTLKTKKKNWNTSLPQILPLRI